VLRAVVRFHALPRGPLAVARPRAPRDAAVGPPGNARRALRLKRRSRPLPRRAGHPSHRPEPLSAPVEATTANLGSVQPNPPASAPTAFSCTHCCSPPRSRDPPSSHLARTPAPVVTTAWRRGLPPPAALLHQPSPQNVLRRAPSQLPRLPRPSQRRARWNLRRPRRPPTLGATLRGGNSF
jgi:hypothetical protein